MIIENRVLYDKATQLEKMAEDMKDFCFLKEWGILTYNDSKEDNILTEEESELFEELLEKIERGVYQARLKFDIKTLEDARKRR